MVALGCLSLVIFPLIGVVLGGLLDQAHGAMIGAGIGLALAIGVCGTGVLALSKARR